MATMKTAEEYIEMCRDGLLTVAECTERLERLQVRGGWEGTHFTGYDYRNQRWITV